MKDEFDASRSRINCSPSRNFSNTDENFEKEKKKKQTTNITRLAEQAWRSRRQDVLADDG